jgi:hypothetical protein
VSVETKLAPSFQQSRRFLVAPRFIRETLFFEAGHQFRNILFIAPVRKAVRFRVTVLSPQYSMPNVGNMLIVPPPKSSTERVREFRLRNPGYDRRFMARQRAAEKEAVARFQAEQIAAAQAVAPSEPLMLPAPVEDAMMTQLNRLGKSQSVAEPLPVTARSSTASSESARLLHGVGYRD